MALNKTPGITVAAASSAADAPHSSVTEQNSHAQHSGAMPERETYWAKRWSLVRHLPKLHDAALFVAQIGGRM